MYIDTETISNIVVFVVVGFAYGLIVVDVIARAFDKKPTKLILGIGGIFFALMFMRIIGVL